MNKYIIGLFIALGLIILLVVLIVSGSSSGSSKKSVYLPNYINHPNSSVSMTMVGPITSNQTHNYLTITVSPSSVVYNLYQGYGSNLINSKIYNNTNSSYRALLYALYYDGFDLGNNTSKLSNSTGYCSIGDVYIFRLSDNGNTISKYWATNCSSTPSTYSGQLGATISLFKAQVPDYQALTSNANF